MTKTIGIDGRKYRDLQQGSTVAAYSMQPVRGLATPGTIPHLGATQPKAPVGYAWPHLQQPARAIRGQITPKAPCYFVAAADAEQIA